jgi:hypothetical protein
MDDGDADGFDAEDAEDADVERDDGAQDDPPTFIAQPQLWLPQATIPSYTPASPAQTMVPGMYMQDHPLPMDMNRAGPSSMPPPPRRNLFGETPLVETSASPPPLSDAGSNRSSNGAGFFRNYLTRQNAPNGAHSPTSRSMDGGTHTPDLIFAEIGHGRGIGAPAPSTAGPSSYSRYSPYATSNGHSTQSFAGGVGHAMTRNGHPSPTSPPSASSVNAHYSPTHQASNWSRRPSGDPSMSSTSSPMPEGPASSASSLAPTPHPSTPTEGDNVSLDSRRLPKRTFRNALNSVFGRPSGDGAGGRGGGSNMDGSPRGY